MKIIYKTGDLLAASESYICHGCNAQGVMGSGVAKLIREKYPEAYEAYRAAYDNRGLHLGQTIWVPGNPHTVINAITQKNYGNAATTGAVYVDYHAVLAVMRDINMMMKDKPGAHIAFPLIGAGLAGGSWNRISAIIEEESVAFQPVVYLLDGVIPTH